MSYTKAIFFQNNKICYCNIDDILLYQYIVPNMNSNKKSEEIPRLLTDYIKLWCKIITNDEINIKHLSVVKEIDENETYDIIIDNMKKIIQYNNTVFNYDDVYKNFMDINQYLSIDDYDEDEIDYMDITMKENYKFTSWPKYTFIELLKKNKEENNDEYETIDIEEVKKQTCDYVTKKYGDIYLSKEYLNMKLNNAIKKMDLYKNILKNKSSLFIKNKLATQYYRQYRYQYNHHYLFPYRYIVTYVNFTKTQKDKKSFDFLEEFEIKFINIPTNYEFGIKDYCVVYDDNYDHCTNDSYNWITKCQNIIMSDHLNDMVQDMKALFS